MTQTLPGADIRGYYAGLGVTLPARATDNANVRCFADPIAHRHGDRNPSCSVNLTTGAWNCHGCGAKGGAFDAATAHRYYRTGPRSTSWSPTASPSTTPTASRAHRHDGEPIINP